jgi:hypothetical protein
MSASNAGKKKTVSELPTTRGALSTLLRSWAVRDDEELSAEDSCSTLYRFFRSKHVSDLRLALNLVLILFCINLLIVETIAIGLPISHLLNSLKSPAVRGDTFIPFDHAVNVLETRVLPVFGTFIGAAISIYGAALAWSYVAASKRLGVVDLFAYEIGTLCRVGTIFDIGKRYVAAYHSKDDITRKHAAIKPTAAEHQTDEQSPRSFISQENFFLIFDKNSSDLQSLEALVVGHITQFYIYMKTTRDLQRKLALVDVSQATNFSKSETRDSTIVDLWHETVADIIYVLFLGYESARKAIADLIEFQPTRAENTIVILLTELVCFSFLCEYFKHDSVRFSRLQLRLSDYENIVPELIEEVNSGYHGNQKKYWAPAQRTIAELKARYIAALDSMQQYAIMNNAASREVSVTMRHHDKSIAAAIPGSTVMLEIQVQNKGLVPLRYSWTSPSAKLADSDMSSVALTLPRGPQQTVLFVDVTNEEGGALTASVAIPLANGPASQDGPVLKILFDNGCL